MSIVNADLEGFSLRRNGSCTADEQDCGPTWGPFRRCCPGNTKCPADKGAPGICCPTTNDCSAALVNKARCADHTAELYYLEQTEGYFCCTSDMLGLHRISNNFVGCAKDFNGITWKVEPMKPVDQYTIPASTSSSTATATPTTSSSTSGPSTETSTSSNNASTNGSHSNTGAIAGGVVGGVAGAIILVGLAWFLLRRRKKHPQYSQPSEPPPGPVSELSDSNRITELSSQSIGELPASEPKRHSPVELAT